MAVRRRHPVVHRVASRGAERTHADADDRALNLRIAGGPQVSVGADHGHRGELRLQLLVERRADPLRSRGQRGVVPGVGGDADSVRGGDRRTGQRHGHHQDGDEREPERPDHVRRRVTNAAPMPTAARMIAPPASQRAVLSAAAAGAPLAVISSWPDPVGAAPVSFTSGAGCSGSPPSASGGWSQFTTVPSKYVWVAGKVTLSPSGSFTETRNSANWSDEMPTFGSAVQVTPRTVPAPVSRSRVAAQPGMT